MSFNELKDYLFQKHFHDSSDSELGVMSSHWKKFGDYKVMRNQDGTYKDVKASAFGDFRKDSFFNKLRFFFELESLNKLIPEDQLNKELLVCGRKIAKSQGRLLDFDCLKQIAALSNIIKVVNIKELKSFCIIGDGYGFLASVLKEFVPESKILNVNLGKTLFFDVYYTEMAHSNYSACLLSKDDTCLNDNFNFLEAENYQVLSNLNIDMFLNIASFQEMDNSIIDFYFKYIKESKAPNKFIYACNRVEKKLPDGEVTRIDNYAWDGGIKIIDSYCKWYDYYPTNKPPFKARFDGDFKEKLYKFGGNLL